MSIFKNWGSPALLLVWLVFSTSACSWFKIPSDENKGGYSKNPDNSNLNREDRLRLDIAGYAEEFIGIPYVWAGTSPKTGFDCSGFTSYVLDNFGIKVSHSSQAQEKEGKKVRIEEVRPGDLIFYRRSPIEQVFHVSLVVENNREGITVIHSVSRGVVRENITKSSYWAPMVSSARNVVSR